MEEDGVQESTQDIASVLPIENLTRAGIGSRRRVRAGSTHDVDNDGCVGVGHGGGTLRCVLAFPEAHLHVRNLLSTTTMMILTSITTPIEPVPPSRIRSH